MASVKQNKLHDFVFKVCCGFLLLLSNAFLPVYAVSGVSNLPAGATGTPTAQDMIVNLATQVPDLMRMVTALAYLMGIYFLVVGLFKLKQFGESRTMMSGERDLKGPLIYLIVGALLVYLPSTIRIGLSSFWVNPNPYGYLQESSQWSQLTNVFFLIMQLIGTIAFIRGLVLMSHIGDRGGQPGTFNKAMAHIIGGILCINIYEFVQVIMVTLGIQP